MTSPRKLPDNYRFVQELIHEHGSGTHLTPSDLLALARRRRPSFGYATLYRALGRLRDLGLIAEVSLPGADAAAYEAVAPEHAHFRCARCGLIADVPFALPPATLREIAERERIDVTGVAITFNGVCADCRAPSPTAS